MSRYIVIEVGCLECADGDNCGPEVVGTTDELAEAYRLGRKPRYSAEYDLVIIDTEFGEVVPREPSPPRGWKPPQGSPYFEFFAGSPSEGEVEE